MFLCGMFTSKHGIGSGIVCFGYKREASDLPSSRCWAKDVGRDQSSARSHASALRSRPPRCRAAAFVFFFFFFFSRCLVASGNCSGGPVGGSCKKKKRIPLHVYKRSGAACNSSGCEIPPASEESRTGGAGRAAQAALLEQSETGLETCRYWCVRVTRDIKRSARQRSELQSAKFYPL